MGSRIVFAKWYMEDGIGQTTSIPSQHRLPNSPNCAADQTNNASPPTPQQGIICPPSNNPSNLRHSDPPVHNHEIAKFFAGTSNEDIPATSGDVPRGKLPILEPKWQTTDPVNIFRPF